MRAIERQSTRFWALEYLARQRMHDTFEVLVVEPVSGGYTVELTDLFLRGYLPTSARYDPGVRLRVKIVRIDPKRDVLRFKEADSLS